MTSTVILWGLLYGSVLGLFYFGGLWLTVRRLHRVARPHRLLLYSFCIRIVPVMVVLWLTIRQQPLLFACTLIAFFLVRFVLSRWSGVRVTGESHASQS